MTEGNSTSSEPLSHRNEKGIIYNVTIKVEPQIADAWLQWLLEEHIPAIMQTSCFTYYKLVKLLEVDDSDGPTYAIQYHAASKDDYNKYIDQFAQRFSKKSFDK